MPYFSSPDVPKSIRYDSPGAALAGGYMLKMPVAAAEKTFVPEQDHLDSHPDVDQELSPLQEALRLLRPVDKDAALTLPDMDTETPELNGYNYALYLMRLAMQGRPMLAEGRENPAAARTAAVFKTHRDALIAAKFLPDYDFEFTPAELDGTAAPDNVVYIHAAA